MEALHVSCDEGMTRIMESQKNFVQLRENLDAARRRYDKSQNRRTALMDSWDTLR
ncbi:hypothetical protein A2U01_0098941, partial [Trifolium medium]|nr:hypothetical protein [Trifolium medium]